MTFGGVEENLGAPPIRDDPLIKRTFGMRENVSGAKQLPEAVPKKHDFPGMEVSLGVPQCHREKSAVICVHQR